MISSWYLKGSGTVFGGDHLKGIQAMLKFFLGVSEVNGSIPVGKGEFPADVHFKMVSGSSSANSRNLSWTRTQSPQRVSVP